MFEIKYNKTIVGIGEILFDVFPDRKILGGAPANFAYHMSQFGYKGYTVSAIGNDPLGNGVLRSLDEKNMSYLIETTDYPTGIVEVLLNDKGIPEYNICENVAWDNIPYTRETEELAKNTYAVCFGSLAQRNKLSHNTIRKFIEAMPQSSIKIFDINLRLKYYSKQLIHESLMLANAVKLNDEELVVIAKLFDWSNKEDEVCQRLLEEYNLTLVILTKGEFGSTIFTKDNNIYTQETPKVKITDTVGAGDSFTASFFASYISGRSIEESHQLAVEVAAYVCTQYGAMVTLPNKYLNFIC